MKKIIFIDDDYSSIKATYFLGCQISFSFDDVMHFHQPEQALEYLKDNSNNVLIIVLDIMFAGDGEFDGGFTKGSEFYKNELAKNYPNIKVIVLTHTPNAKNIPELEGCEHIYQKTDSSFGTNDLVNLIAQANIKK